MLSPNPGVHVSKFCLQNKRHPSRIIFKGLGQGTGDVVTMRFLLGKRKEQYIELYTYFGLNFVLVFQV